MNYQEIHKQLNRLQALNLRFDKHLKSTEQDWDAILLEHLLLCQLEEYVKIKENR